MSWPVPFSPSPCTHQQSLVPSAQSLPVYPSLSRASAPCYPHPRCFLVLPPLSLPPTPSPCIPTPSYR